MKNDNVHPTVFYIILPIGLLIFLFSLWTPVYEYIGKFSISSLEHKTSKLQGCDDLDAKHKGAHVFGYLDSINLQPICNNNFDWITMVPYGSQPDFDSSSRLYRIGDSLDKINRDAVWKKEIDIAHSQGFKVFLKPHIWLNSPSKGKWRSDIFPSNEDNWLQWQKEYRDFILLFAEIAQQNDVELFCIGTELSRLSVEKSDFWKSLIQEIRNIYDGKLTYAANWYNEYEKITFWEELDYIGIQAYFPLVKNKYPSVQQVSKGWKKYLSDIESIHEKYNRKILFTEMGYKSTADSAIEPWQWLENTSSLKEDISLETQANCYEAFFDMVWNKDWFAGVHIWQMRSEYNEEQALNSLNFSPQGKPAEKVIASGFE